jgi:hypothetical protein
MMTNIFCLVKLSFVMSFVLFYAFIGQFIPWIALIYYGCWLANSSTIIWYQLLGYGMIGLSLPVGIICHCLPFVLFCDTEEKDK